MKLTRRTFLATSAAAAGARLVPAFRGRRVLTLVYDKSIGAMRAIDRLVP
ncbi:MAG: Tat pathway signal protein [Pseudomonadota bacterium]